MSTDMNPPIRHSRLLATFAVASISIIAVILLLLYFGNSPSGPGHEAHRLTMKRILWWHKGMEDFVTTFDRAPASREELHGFLAQKSYDGTGVQEALVDAWGNELLIEIIQDGEATELCVRSAGPDGRFDQLRSLDISVCAHY